jgi:hypothetical protein
MVEVAARSSLGGITGRERSMEKVKIERHGAEGPIWICGWLFTIGLLHLFFWRGVLAIVIWPYYVGMAVHGFIHW